MNALLVVKDYSDDKIAIANGYRIDIYNRQSGEVESSLVGHAGVSIIIIINL